MALQIKVKGGTPRHRENLCLTCNKCHRMLDDSGEQFFCRAVGFTIGYTQYYAQNLTGPVYECSSYEIVTALSKMQLIDMAWIIEVDKTGRHIGFSRYSELEQDKRDRYRTEVYRSQ